MDIVNTVKDIDVREVSSGKAWFFFTMLFLVIDYGRPQDVFPIGSIRPAMIIILVLSFFIFTRGDFRRFDSKQTRLILYFIALLCIYVPFARNNFFAWMTAKEMFLYMPFILSVMACVISLDRLKTTIFVLICLMIYVAIYSLTHHGMGSGNYFKDENDLCLYINMYLPFCYFLMLYDQRKKMKLFYAFALITGLSAVVVSFSRGGFVGLLATGFVVWLVSSRKVISLILIVLIGVTVYYFASDAYLTEMSTITEDTNAGTSRERTESWKAGWRMFLDNPLGVGGNNFQVRFPEYQSEYFKRGMWGRVAHSLWFTLIPELGIPGIIIYFSLLYYNIKDINFLRKLEAENKEELKYLRFLSLAIIAAFAGYFASGTFLSVLYYPHYWYLTAILVAITKIAKDMTRQEAIIVKC